MRAQKLFYQIIDRPTQYMRSDSWSEKYFSFYKDIFFIIQLDEENEIFLGICDISFLLPASQ